MTTARAEAAARRCADYLDTAKRVLALAKQERAGAERAKAGAEAAAARAEAAAAKARKVPVIIGAPKVPKGNPRMFNESRQNQYLAHLFDGKMRGAAAKLVGVTLTEVARVRKVDPDFAEKEREAETIHADAAAQALIDMAHNDPRAAIWVTKHFGGGRFDEKTGQIDVKVSGQIDHAHAGLDPTAQIAEIMALAAQRAELRALPAGPPDIEGEVIEPED